MNDTHPQIDEATKQLRLAKESFGRAVFALDSQYLKPLIGVGDPKTIAAINDLRERYADVSEAVAHVTGEAKAFEQPEDPPTDVPAATAASEPAAASTQKRKPKAPRKTKADKK